MVRLLLCRYKYCSPVSAESCEGIELVRLLLYRYKDVSLVRELIDGDIVPLKPLPGRFN